MHLADAGAAVEAGLPRPDQPDPDHRAAARPAVAEAERAVVAVVAGPGLADAVEALAARRCCRRPHVRRWRTDRAAERTTCGDLVVLPNDMECLEIATHLAAELRRRDGGWPSSPPWPRCRAWPRWPCTSRRADFDSAVVAMSSAAGHARHGGGHRRRERGDDHGRPLRDGRRARCGRGDFVEIGDSVAEVAWRCPAAATPGGELLTLVPGAEVDDGPAVSELAERSGRRRPGSTSRCGRRPGPLSVAAGAGMTVAPRPVALAHRHVPPAAQPAGERGRRQDREALRDAEDLDRRRPDAAPAPALLLRRRAERPVAAAATARR